MLLVLLEAVVLEHLVDGVLSVFEKLLHAGGGGESL